jgi:hypothetical protein
VPFRMLKLMLLVVLFTAFGCAKGQAPQGDGSTTVAEKESIPVPRTVVRVYHGAGSE